MLLPSRSGTVFVQPGVYITSLKLSALLYPQAQFFKEPLQMFTLRTGYMNEVVVTDTVALDHWREKIKFFPSLPFGDLTHMAWACNVNLKNVNPTVCTWPKLRGACQPMRGTVDMLIWRYRRPLYPKEISITRNRAGDKPCYCLERRCGGKSMKDIRLKLSLNTARQQQMWKQQVPVPSKKLWKKDTQQRWHWAL